MRTVHWTGIHIQCSMEAVFNVRVATPRGNVPSTARKCAVPTDHLCSEISFSRTSNSPDLISYIYRICSVTLDTLYWLCMCLHGCTSAFAKTNICLVYIFSEGTLLRWVANNFWGSCEKIFYAHSCITFGVIEF